MAAPVIEPRTLKGFRDFLPATMIPRERLMETARRVYRSFGFAPIDTPTLEYHEILAGKGGDESDRLMYAFEDQGGRKVGMRFDLTVPLARFAAQHVPQLGTPFKRYHIAPVWRGENTHRGRYREFVQCDYDTIGTTAPASDAETVLVAHELMQAIVGPDFVIRINDRRVLTGLLSNWDVAERSGAVLRALDKLEKVGEEVVAGELSSQAGLTSAQIEPVLTFARLGAQRRGQTDALLAEIERLVAGSETGLAGVAGLRQTLALCRAAGVAEANLTVDPAIARGLDYYTGLVFETNLTQMPDIGSVASGGRYDNLAGLYTKQDLPGVGGSLGLDRLLAALEELGRLETAETPAAVLVTMFDATSAERYFAIAQALRRAGIAAEVYPEAKKIGQQLKYADKKGHRVAVIAGEREFAESRAQVKDLRRQAQRDVPLDAGFAALCEAVSRVLGLG